ncbi:MAG: CPBP family intramembrane metalloprotease [Tatlockia sp.]|nr:CPBP family intramembrane metalloprotease [Tatlockia sp.]
MSSYFCPHVLVFYKLSFIFPGYVESYLNEKNFTNVGEAILWIFYTILLAPLIDELLFHGIILQKWSIKWGVRSGIITTSLLFAVFDFSFDIVPLFIRSILYSILYFKTRNLLDPVLCQTFHNTITTIFDIVNFFSKSTIEREFFISASDYQASLQPLLGLIVFLMAITAPLIGYFISKNFPKNDVLLPYTELSSSP